ncbi:MAG: PRC-barrel domain-containing protein [Afipia sp.]|nr:PRC-barrel domain-containing protein [Afipia sp.]
MIAKYMATALLGTALLGGAAFAQTATPSASSPPAASAGIQQNLKGNWRASKLVGLSVYNDANENLGSISEILVDNTGKINAVVIGVGGFLGVGQHDIAVSFDKLKWVNEPICAASTDRAPAAPGMSPSSTATPSTTTTGAAGGGMAAASATKDNWYPDHAVMSGTKEQLKALPAFKYSDYN